jgi:hypothetical protein
MFTGNSNGIGRDKSNNQDLDFSPFCLPLTKFWPYSKYYAERTSDNVVAVGEGGKRRQEPIRASENETFNYKPRCFRHSRGAAGAAGLRDRAQWLACGGVF